MKKLKITVANKIILKETPDNLKELLINNLTIKNPAYLEAERLGYSTYKIPEFINNFNIMPDNSLRIPRGYRNKLLRHIDDLNIDFTIENKLVFNTDNIGILNKTETILRSYQRKYLYKLLSSGNTEGVIVSPAGSGKTVFGIALAAALGQNTLWLTHRKLLLKQTQKRFLCNMTELRPEDIGLICKGKWNINPIFTIASLDTMRGNVAQIRKLSKLFGLVVLDECLPKGTNILMLDGSIKDISKVNNGESTTFGIISNKFSREADTLIELRGGWGTITGTETHQLPIITKDTLTKDKHTGIFYPPTEKNVIMSTMKNIHKKDLLLIKEGNCHTEKYNIGIIKSRLLALIACDGHIDKHSRCIQVGIVKDKEWFRNEMLQATSLFQDNDLRNSDCKRGDLIIRNYSKEAVTFLSKYISKGKKRELYVPNIMEYASYEDIKNYLQVVFDTEGGLNTNQITITMSTPEFLIGIQHLLRKFEIVSRIIPIKKKKILSKEYSRLAMSGYDAFLFYHKIGFSMKRKQDELLNIIKRVNKFVRRVEYNGVIYRCMEVLTKKEIYDKTIVYDFTTDKHFFIANGVLSSNCHHCPATTFNKIISELNPYFLFGLTATAYRSDGLTPLMFHTMGDIVVNIPIEEVVAAGGIVLPTVYYRVIGDKIIDGNNIHEILKTLMLDDQRNDIIVKDIIKEAKNNKINMVVSSRKEHCEILFKKIKYFWEKTGIITGDYSDKHNDLQIKKLENGELTVIVATLEKLGEGVDIDILENGFICLPFRSEQDVEQLVGRLQRAREGKTEAKIYEYIDDKVGVVRDQFTTPTKNKECRLNAYNRLGIVVKPLE